MKIIKRILIGLSALLFLLLITVVVYLFTTRPVLSGELSLNGLTEPVEVLFDEYGIPHIYAKNENDAYLALGYVHAQDRLFQMEMIRRAAAGRLAEVLGPDLLKTDKLFRTLCLNKVAEAQAAKFLGSDTSGFQKAVIAYQKGVNEFIRKGKTPIEFTLMGIPKEEFTPKDIYLTAGIIAFGFAEGLRVDPVLEKIKNEWGEDYLVDLAVNNPYPDRRLKTFDGRTKSKLNDALISFVDDALNPLPFALWQGSNGWAVSGERTASGFPILANDTHMGLTQPTVWYEAHIEYPGFRLYGHHLAGIPFGLLGQNDFCAWGITMFENDEADFFYEETDDNGRVKYKGEWVDMEWRKERIKVKGSVDVEITIPITPHGSIINDVIDFAGEEKPVALSWIMNHPDNQGLQGVYDWNHAQSLSEFENAASLFAMPGINLMYADRDGNIAWWAAARLPVRPAHVNSKFFLDGSSGRDDYQGYYDFSKNPHAINPPSGFVYTTNNQPDTVEGVLYPGYYYQRSRAERLEELLKENKKWTRDDMKAINLDVISHMHADIAHEIAAILKSSDRKDWEFMITQLESWNGAHEAGEVAPALYNNLLSQIMRLAMADEISHKAFETIASTSLMKNTFEMFIKNENSPWWDNKNTPETETRLHIVEAAARKTIKLLTGIAGSNPQNWNWGKIHLLTHKHAFDAVKPLREFFNVGPFQVNGGSEVLNNLHYKLDTTGYFAVDGGPALRKITDWGDPENGETVSPTGQSGNVMSPHYSDQALMYATGKFRTMKMNRTGIESQSKKLVLAPAR
jgi:penicillin G amidase